jgi:glycosyltransferase involved in cell wall biosynthesis
LKKGTILSYNPQNVDVICFGGQDWWYHNRGHIDVQLMRRFAKNGITLYINSIIIQKLNIGQTRKFAQRVKRKLKSIYTGLQRVQEGFWVYSPLSLPVQHINRIKCLNEKLLWHQISHVIQKIGMSTPVVWVACPSACDLALKLKRKKLVYQRTDRYEDFPGVNHEVVRKYDRKLKVSADLTIYVNNSLYAEEAEQCKRAFYLDHGVDYEMFAMAEQNISKPEDIAGVPTPIVGFFGDIEDHTFDIPFMERVVGLLTEMSFVLVGKVSSDTTGLQEMKNVWLLGKKLYDQVPYYGKCFDVAIMPWRQNSWIEACNPVKLKEYLALGKPIVSTPFPELKKYRDVVYIANTPEDFAHCIVKALNENSSKLIAARREKVKNDTWDSKADVIFDVLLADKALI